MNYAEGSSDSRFSDALALSGHIINMSTTKLGGTASNELVGKIGVCISAIYRVEIVLISLIFHSARTFGTDVNLYPSYELLHSITTVR